MKWIANRKACGGCGAHRALFFTRRGRIRWSRDHVLCVRCFRSLRDHSRAVQVVQTPAAPIAVMA